MEEDEILRTLRNKEKDIEAEFYTLEKRLQRIFAPLFEEPTSPIFDWLLRVVEKPQLASVLGMPSTGGIEKHIRPLLASDSGFGEAMRTQIAHRLYSIFQIWKWLVRNPLCPQWVKFYKDIVYRMDRMIKNEYISLDEPDKVNIRNAWRLAEPWKKWDGFHDVTSLDVPYLLPTLEYLNNPGCFGKEMRVFKDDEESDVLTEFVDKLQTDMNKLEIFVDFAKLLWCIDTFLINPTIAATYDPLLKNLIDELENRWENKREQVLKPDRTFKMKMPAPEIYTAERTLLFSAGWALEIVLLCNCYRLSDNNKFDTLKVIAKSIAIKGIEIVSGKATLTSEDRPPYFHLYSMCQRLWFLVECWHYRAIASAIEFKDKIILECKELKKVDHETNKVIVQTEDNDEREVNDNEIAVIKTVDRIYWIGLWERLVLADETIREEERLPKFEEVKNSEELPGTLYSIFILGGAGVGKTTLVEKVLQGKYDVDDCIRCTPLDIERFKDLYAILQSTARWTLWKRNKFIILFFDEIHLETQISPFALMLDLLQEGRLQGKKLLIKILYVFASSSFRTQREFVNAAKEKRNIAMVDFGTRIGHWIELPDLWQVPEQKFVLGYLKANNDASRQRIASLVAINAELKNPRAIERAIKDEEKLQKSTEKYIRGDILRFFE